MFVCLVVCLNVCLWFSKRGNSLVLWPWVAQMIQQLIWGWTNRNWLNPEWDLDRWPPDHCAGALPPGVFFQYLCWGLPVRGLASWFGRSQAHWSEGYWFKSCSSKFVPKLWKFYPVNSLVGYHLIGTIIQQREQVKFSGKLTSRWKHLAFYSFMKAA